MAVKNKWTETKVKSEPTSSTWMPKISATPSTNATFLSGGLANSQAKSQVANVANTVKNVGQTAMVNAINTQRQAAQNSQAQAIAQAQANIAKTNSDLLARNTNTGGGGGGGTGGSGGAATPTVAQNASAYASAFQPSAAYQQAMAYTQSLLDKLTSGKTEYTDKVNEMLKNLENYKKFSYDMTQDALFQNALSGAMSSGQLAMQDTIGQASALTGGYGSTYATGAANQAYNSMIQGAFDKLPEFYQMARDAYNEDYNREVNKFGMYADMDKTAYDRLKTAYDAHYQNTSDMYNREYTDFWNNKNFDNQNAQFNAEMGYKNAKLAQDQANWEKEYALEVQKAQASAKKQEDAENKLIAPTAKQYETALALYNKGGDGANSEYRNYINSLPENVDIDELDSYVMGKGDERQINLVSRGNIFKKDDNTFTDQWGNEYTYQQLLDMGYTKDEIKKFKSK